MTFWPSQKLRKISGMRSLSTKCVANDPVAIVLLTLLCPNRRSSNGRHTTRISG